jgi:hypothetical protein
MGWLDEFKPHGSIIGRAVQKIYSKTGGASTPHIKQLLVGK